MGSNSTLTLLFFLVDEGREDPNTTKRRPLSAHQHFAGVPTMALHCILARKLCDFFQVIRTSIARKPYIFVIFKGGRGGGPASLMQSNRMGHS